MSGRQSSFRLRPRPGCGARLACEADLSGRQYRARASSDRTSASSVEPLSSKAERWNNGVVECWWKGRPTGGEPLCSVAVLSVSSRRLPGMTERVIAPSVFVLSRTRENFLRKSNRRAAPGSRLLPTHRAAAPQSGSSPRVGISAPTGSTTFSV